MNASDLLQYIPVHLKAIRLDRPPGIDLFVRNPGGEFVLYLSGTHVFTQAHRSEVKTRAAGRIYTRAAERDAYLAQVEPEIAVLMQDPALDDRERAELVYASSLKVARDMFQNPSYANIMRTQRMGDALTDFIFSDTEAARGLLSVRTHDEYTYEHSLHVGILGISLVRELAKGGRGVEDPHRMGFAFFMHDLGKVSVPAEIINSPNKLTEEEWKRMRAHPYQGYKILQEHGLLSEECSQVVYCHHERNDGRGYPRGLKGDEIPYYGRIGVIADVFDALTARRSYKPALSTFEALRVMKEEMTGFFDREMFTRFTLLFAAERVDTDAVLRNVLYQETGPAKPA